MVNVAMLSKWHVHARGYAKEFMENENATVTVVWDEDPKRGAEWAKELGVDFEPSLDAVLAREDVDAVAIDTPTSMHLEVIKKATAAKKHIFTEKTLCLTEADALEAARLIQEAGVKFCISMPQLVSPEIHFIQQAIEKGWLGNVSVFRMRNAHNGSSANWLPAYWYAPEDAGGGAMMDLGCHCVYIANWLFGDPKRVAGVYNIFNDRPVDENAMMTVEYKNKAVAILETSFVSHKSPRSVEVYGDEGVILWTRNGLEMTSTQVEGFEEDFAPVTDLPEGLPKPIEQFVAAIEADDDSLIFSDLDMGVALSNVLEKSYISDEKNVIFEF